MGPPVHCPTGVPISEKSHLVYVQITKYYQFPPKPVHCQNQVPFSEKSHLAYVPISVAALYLCWKIMDGVLLRTVLSTYIHKDHVFRDIEKDLRKLAKGILAYAVEAIAYCCG